MLKDKNKIKNPQNPPNPLYVKGVFGDKPSRFVIDLREKEGEGLPPQKQKEKKMDWEKMYEKFSEFNVKNYLEEKKRNIKKNKEIIKESLNKPVKLEKDKIKKTISTLIKNAQPIDFGAKPLRPSIGQSVLLFFHITDKARQAYLIYYEKLNRLFIVSFLRFIFHILQKIQEWFYKLCYITGWLFIFLIRLIYFSLLGAVKLVYPAPFRISHPPAAGSKEQIFRAELNTLPQRCGIYWSFRTMAAGLKPIGRNIQSLLFVFAEKKKDDVGEARIKHLKHLKQLEKEISLAVKERKEKLSSTPPYKRSELSGQNLPRPLSRAIEQERQEGIIGLSFKSLRSIYVFALVLLILIAPFKIFTYYKSLGFDNLRAKVLGASLEAIYSLKTGSEEAGQFNFSQARQNFSHAAGRFLEAQNELRSVNDFLFKLAAVMPDKEAQFASQGREILLAGEIVSRLGSDLSLMAENLFGDTQSEAKDIKSIINNIIIFGGQALENAGKLKTALNEIDIENLPLAYKEQFVSVKDRIFFLREGLAEFVSLAQEAEKFLGFNANKRYLLVFQNNAEMRASGGFIGSYALIDFQDGKIKNIEVPSGGSYDTEAGLYDLVAAPEPLWLVNPLWHFWDANWWPDWPTSAGKLQWFYEHSGGPTVDGVISLTPTVIEELLGIIGPIDMTAEYGVVIDSSNFWDVTKGAIEESNAVFQRSQTATSSSEIVLNKPKKIIGDLTAKILEELPKRLDKSNLVNLMKVLDKSLSEKHLLFYFAEKELQKKIKDYGWDGSVKHTAWDYLMVVNTNIAGGKSDRKIRETISHRAEVMLDGSIIDTIKVKREHTGEKSQLFFGVRNVDWMRIYVPLGSKLLEAEGFSKPDEIYFERPVETWRKDADLGGENSAAIHYLSGTKIYEEAGKTVFANWSMVDPGETIIIHLKYQLPFKLTPSSSYKLFDKIIEAVSPDQNKLTPYTLLAQKQSGSLGSILKSELVLPPERQVVWYYPQKEMEQDSGWQIEDVLNTDKYWAGIIEIKN